ncbi:serine hydrolase domain-containing protein [Actinoplanes sp. NPDC004185]
MNSAGSWYLPRLLGAGLAVVTALATHAPPATASPARTVTDAGPADVVQRDVDLIQAIGTSGVLAETIADTTVTRARAGVARLGTTTPVDWNSHFRIGSTTKTFVSTVVLQLTAEGRLSLTDTVDRWLPGLVQGRGNNGDSITVRHLLQHTSGLYDYTEDDAFFGSLMTPEAFAQHRFDTYTAKQLVALAMNHAPNFAAGARWEYSNTNFILAGLIIEAVTGEPWAAQIRKRIITPLRLTGTSEPGTDPAMPAPAPNGYQLYGTDGVYTDTTQHNMTWGGSAGSLISTPHDINTFLRALMTGKLLDPRQLTAMTTTVPMGKAYEAIWPGAAYGLGIFRTDLPCGGFYWHHGGDVIGYSDTNGVTPDGRRSAMVASSTNTFTDPVFADKAIASNNQLVRHALCGTDTGPVAAAGTHPRPLTGPSPRHATPR